MYLALRAWVAIVGASEFCDALFLRTLWRAGRAVVVSADARDDRDEKPVFLRSAPEAKRSGAEKNGFLQPR